MHKPGIFSQLMNIEVNNEKHFVLPRDIQQHPVSEEAEHVDFLRVTKNATVAVGINVEFVNEDKCTGLKLGGGIKCGKSTGRTKLSCNINT